MRFVRVLTVTSLDQRIDFYPPQYFATKPCVFIQRFDGGTNPAIAVLNEYFPAMDANVFSALRLTWPAGSLGKEFSLEVFDE